MHDIKRAALLSEIRRTAQARIKQQVFDNADEALAEISGVSKILAAEYDGVVSIPALKGEARASQKVAWDYSGDWHGIKDIARLTIIVPTEAGCAAVQKDLGEIFHPSNGATVMQVKTIVPQMDPCGYSSLFVVVRASNGYPAEIQINTPTMIYAKSKESSVRSIIGDEFYGTIVGKYRLAGGFGHALYEIYRVAPGSKKAQSAAALSKDYYSYFRSPAPDPKKRDMLSRQLAVLDIPAHLRQA